MATSLTKSASRISGRPLTNVRLAILWTNHADPANRFYPAIGMAKAGLPAAGIRPRLRCRSC